MLASRHRILKEGLTVVRRDLVCAWLMAHGSREIMQKSGRHGIFAR
jgi:hypothetical protein